MTLDLGRDLFTVEADARRPSDHEIARAIRDLGYRPLILGRAAPVALAAPAPVATAPTAPLVQAALARAAREGKLVILDFGAEWCTACQRMLRESWADARVAALVRDHFVFVPVDADEHAEVAAHFGVVGLPDARVLAPPDGREVARLQGFLAAPALAARLQALLGRP